ncbi:Alpha/Beta hydrolase protein [Thelonectria olida]|uniref:Alpha/Beta hydrolase protein n=1 Tax=Thelonectria olida TaxID=1576542 RepID=A0A9P8WBD4_9HYPO|nr:Alpha/Beta hydrolase protein [Thelonectria olida]
MADNVQPFQINIPDNLIQSVKDRLATATFPDEVNFSDDWDYGATLSDVKRLANYWKDGFDWRAQEAKLNQVPQFTTNVVVEGFGEIAVHFVHQRNSNPNSIPLLFCHGWPGSFIEALKLIPLLTASAGGPSFHLVAPSLPNYAFSDGVKKRGFSIPQYAEALHKVMLNLNYPKYVTQGGDWGFAITRMLGVKYPQNVLASHLNFVRVHKPPTALATPWQYLKHAVLPYEASEKAGLARSSWFRNEGFGYNLLQSTKPSTLGFALADSPVALLAWIYEKLHDWSDDYPWTDDEILTWVSLYQFSKAGPEASVRIYYETKHGNPEQEGKVLDYVPGVELGLSYFPKDLVVPPKTWGRTLGPVVFESVHPDGGHFAAHERPKELADDLRNMFGKGGGAYHVAEKFGNV